MALWSSRRFTGTDDVDSKDQPGLQKPLPPREERMQLKQKLQESDASLQAARADNKRLAREITGYSRKHAEFKKQLEGFAVIKRDRADLQAKLKSVEIERNEAHLSFQKEVLHALALEEQLQKLQAELSAVPRLKSDLADRKADLQDKEQQFADVTKQLQQKDQDLQRFQQELQETQQQRQQTEQQLQHTQQQLQDALDHVAAFADKVTAAEHKTQNLTLQYDQLQSTHQDTQQSYQHLQAAHQALQHSHHLLDDKHQQLQQAYEQLQAEQQQLQAEHQHLQQEHKALQDSHEQLEGQRKQLQHSCDAGKQQAAAALQETVALQEQLQQFSSLASNLQELQDKYEALQADYDSASSDAVIGRDRIEQLERQLAAQQEQIEDLQGALASEQSALQAANAALAEANGQNKQLEDALRQQQHLAQNAEAKLQLAGERVQRLPVQVEQQLQGTPQVSKQALQQQEEPQHDQLQHDGQQAGVDGLHSHLTKQLQYLRQVSPELEQFDQASAALDTLQNGLQKLYEVSMAAQQQSQQSCLLLSAGGGSTVGGEPVTAAATKDGCSTAEVATETIDAGQLLAANAAEHEAAANKVKQLEQQLQDTQAKFAAAEASLRQALHKDVAAALRAKTEQSKAVGKQLADEEQQENQSALQAQNEELNTQVAALAHQVQKLQGELEEAKLRAEAAARNAGDAGFQLMGQKRAVQKQDELLKELQRDHVALEAELNKVEAQRAKVSEDNEQLQELVREMQGQLKDSKHGATEAQKLAALSTAEANLARSQHEILQNQLDATVGDITAALESIAGVRSQLQRLLQMLKHMEQQLEQHSHIQARAVEATRELQGCDVVLLKTAQRLAAPLAESSTSRSHSRQTSLASVDQGAKGLLDAAATAVAGSDITHPAGRQPQQQQQGAQKQQQQQQPLAGEDEEVQSQEPQHQQFSDETAERQAELPLLDAQQQLADFEVTSAAPAMVIAPAATTAFAALAALASPPHDIPPRSPRNLIAVPPTPYSTPAHSMATAAALWQQQQQSPLDPAAVHIMARMVDAVSAMPEQEAFDDSLEAIAFALQLQQQQQQGYDDETGDEEADDDYFIGESEEDMFEGQQQQEGLVDNSAEGALGQGQQQQQSQEHQEDEEADDDLAKESESDIIGEQPALQQEEPGHAGVVLALQPQHLAQAVQQQHSGGAQIAADSPTTQLASGDYAESPAVASFGSPALAQQQQQHAMAGVAAAAVGRLGGVLGLSVGCQNNDESPSPPTPHFWKHPAVASAQQTQSAGSAASGSSIGGVGSTGGGSNSSNILESLSTASWLGPASPAEAGTNSPGLMFMMSPVGMTPAPKHASRDTSAPTSAGSRPASAKVPQQSVSVAVGVPSPMSSPINSSGSYSYSYTGSHSDSGSLGSQQQPGLSSSINAPYVSDPDGAAAHIAQSVENSGRVTVAGPQRPALAVPKLNLNLINTGVGSAGGFGGSSVGEPIIPPPVPTDSGELDNAGSADGAGGDTAAAAVSDIAVNATYSDAAVAPRPVAATDTAGAAPADSDCGVSHFSGSPVGGPIILPPVPIHSGDADKGGAPIDAGDAGSDSTAFSNAAAADTGAEGAAADVATAAEVVATPEHHATRRQQQQQLTPGPEAYFTAAEKAPRQSAEDETLQGAGEAGTLLPESDNIATEAQAGAEAATPVTGPSLGAAMEQQAELQSGQGQQQQQQFFTCQPESRTRQVRWDADEWVAIDEEQGVEGLSDGFGSSGSVVGSTEDAFKPLAAEQASGGAEAVVDSQHQQGEQDRQSGQEQLVEPEVAEPLGGRNSSASAEHISAAGADDSDEAAGGASSSIATVDAATSDGSTAADSADAVVGGTQDVTPENNVGSRQQCGAGYAGSVVFGTKGSSQDGDAAQQSMSKPLIRRLQFDDDDSAAMDA